MLADHPFSRIAGTTVASSKGISFTYGHNITIGDNTVVHDDVHLDDRGELTIGDRVSISDGVHIYSHDHDVVDQTEVRNYHTIVEDDVRLTYDSMVQAGNKVGENAIVGARGVCPVRYSRPPIAVGMPAQSVKIKPGWEDIATPSTTPAPTDRNSATSSTTSPTISRTSTSSAETCSCSSAETCSCSAGSPLRDSLRVGNRGISKCLENVPHADGALGLAHRLRRAVRPAPPATVLHLRPR